MPWPVHHLRPGDLYKRGPRRCGGCAFPPEHCLCDAIPTAPSGVRVIVVRHASERCKVSNTGALTARVTGGVLLEHGMPDRRVALGPHLGPDPRLLFPHGSTRTPDTPSAIVVLDGTWHQARGMRARIDPLPSVPVWSLPAEAARERMRAQHMPEGLSTMESVASALDRLGEPEPARALRELYALLTDRWLTLRQAPRAAVR